LSLLVKVLLTRLSHAHTWAQKDMVVGFLLKDFINIPTFDFIILVENLDGGWLGCLSFFVKVSKISQKSY
jgi:hypothetical protein